MTKQSKDIEQQLRDAILTSGISRYRLSKQTGVSQATLSLFVNGHQSLNLTTAAKLARALGLEFRRVPKKGR